MQLRHVCLAAVSAILLFFVLPRQTFLVQKSPKEGPYTSTKKPSAKQSHQANKANGDNSKTDKLNRLVGAVELCLGLGILASKGAITLHAKSAKRAVTFKGGKERVWKSSLSAVGSAIASAETMKSMTAKTSRELTTSAANFKMAEQVGVMAPVGVVGESYWDPLGLAKDANLQQFRQLRAAELKHGRVCMLAELGLILQATGTRFNFGYPYTTEYASGLNLQNAKNGIGAISEYGPASAWFGVLVLLAGFVELGVWRQSNDRAPGDFGDPFRFKAAWFGSEECEPEIARTFEDQELAHGRLAMVAFLGTVLAEYASGYDAIQQWQHAGEAWFRTRELFAGHVVSGYPWGQSF